MDKSAPRAIDHLVLPTAGLEIARRRLSNLGFTVAPDGIHPFGTANCCVYLADGTFLEPLALRDGAAAAAAISDGNVFVARDHVFRAVCGEEGFSAVVLAGNDAARDHAAFGAAGIQAGDMLTFSRQAQDASGNTGTATFRLAFATDRDVADAFVFTCQRVNAPAINRSALERHANGVMAIREIVGGRDSAAFMRLIGRAADESDRPAPNGIELANAVVRPTGPEDPAEVRRCEATLAAIAFRVDDIERTRRVLEAGGIAYRSDRRCLIVPSAPGQGAIFIFAEQA